MEYNFLTSYYISSLILITRVLPPDTPFFSAPISNVTAAVGETAQLACLVESLGPYKVGVKCRGSKMSYDVGVG